MNDSKPEKSDVESVENVEKSLKLKISRDLGLPSGSTEVEKNNVDCVDDHNLKADFPSFPLIQFDCAWKEELCIR